MGLRMTDRYWINDTPTDPHCPDGYVPIVDEREGGHVLYVVAHRARHVFDLLERDDAAMDDSATSGSAPTV